MKFTKVPGSLLLGVALLAFVAVSQAQTTWTNNAGGDWNNALNWNPNEVPGQGTNAFLTNLVPAYAVTYNSPMLDTSVGSIAMTNNAGVGSVSLTVNSSNFNVSGSIIIRAGGKFVTGSAGIVNSGSMAILNTGFYLMSAGAIVTNTGTLGIGNSGAGAGAFTNSGGLLVTAGVTIGSSSDGGPMVISAGTNMLGNFLIGRCGGSSTALPAITTGLVVSNGLVLMDTMVLGNANSWGNMTVVNGIVTNDGDFILGRQVTASRGGRYSQLGGLVVSTTNSGVRMCVNNASQIAAYSVSGGTNIVEGFVMGDSTVSSGTINFTNSGTIVIGATGITNASSGATANVNLNNNGIFYSKADWTGAVPMTLASSGTYTFNAGGLDGTPQNITMLGGFKGSGNLNKLGAGQLILDGTNINTGSVLINSGTLILGATGTLSNATPIIVGSGTTFDVSENTNGFFLEPGKTLSGFGVVTGAVSVLPTGIVNPGSNTLTGTLTFNNDLIENGGAVNHFDVPGDFVNVEGNLDATNANTIEVSGTLPSGSTYALIHYGLAFNGSVSNFTVTGASGSLSNSTVDQTIYLVIAKTVRGPTNVVWLGNPLTNVWDSLDVTNWLDANGLDYFVPGDNAIFNATGAANPIVNITGSVSPNTVLVNAATDYTFTGLGSIDGNGSLTKTNSGNLTILTTNTYNGVTTISGGTLTIAQLTVGGTASSIGSANADPGNLVITNATLNYAGSGDSTDRGAILGGTATFEVTNSVTIDGTLMGSGGLTMIGPGTLIIGGANSYGGSTVLSNGTLQITTTPTAIDNTIVFAGGTVDLTVGSQPTYSNPLDVLTTGTMISAGGNNNIVSGPWSGSGTLNLSVSTGTFTVNANMTTNFTGTVLLSDASTGTFRFNSGGTSSGAQVSTGSPTATFDLGNSSVTLLNRNGGGSSFGTYFLGALAGGGSTFLKGSANSSSPTTYQIGDKNLTTVFGGSIQDGAGGSSATLSIIKTGTGAFIITGNNNTYTGQTIISNGVLALSNSPAGDASIANSSTINITAGTFLDVSGRSDDTLQLGSGQQLIGRGTLLGNLNVQGGTVIPGGGLGGNTGVLTVTNAISLGGTVVMKLNRTNSLSSDELVSSLSTITYGSTLTVTNIGPTLHPGDTFTLFSGLSLNSGNFGQINLPNYYSWDISQLGVNGTISVTGTLPGPHFTTIDASQLANGTLNLNAAGGAPSAPFTILSTTDLTQPITNWTTVATGNFDTGGSLGNFGVTVDPNAPQEFFVIEAQ